MRLNGSESPLTDENDISPLIKGSYNEYISLIRLLRFTLFLATLVFPVSISEISKTSLTMLSNCSELFPISSRYSVLSISDVFLSFRRSEKPTNTVHRSTDLM